MKLTRICKSENSSWNGGCPAVYAVDGDPGMMVSQGKTLDPATAGELQDLATDETAAFIPTETVLRAAAKYLAWHGRESVAADVESFLKDQKGAVS